MVAVITFEVLSSTGERRWDVRMGGHCEVRLMLRTWMRSIYPEIAKQGAGSVMRSFHEEMVLGGEWGECDVYVA